MNTVTYEHKAPVATGNPWMANPEDQVTVPVPLPVIIVSVEGPYTALDRKLWAFLLHTVWEELGEKVIHEVLVRDIVYVFRQLKSRHHTDWIWESADRLAGTKVKWIRVEGDRRYRGVDNLLGAETDEDAQKEGVLRFNFPPLLVPILKDPKRFARLRTHFMIELSGKYAVTLYQLLESAANKETPELIASVEELRRWLKVPEGKMLRWQDFRRKVLEQGLRQINDSSEGAGFTVVYKPIKDGRSIQRVRFVITKTAAREKMEERLRASERQLVLPLSSGVDEAVGSACLPPLANVALAPGCPDPASPDAADASPAALLTLLLEAGLSKRDAAKIARLQWAYVDDDARPEKATDEAFETYIRDKIDLLARQKKAPRSRTGFLLKAIRENWANPQLTADQQKSAAWQEKVARDAQRQQLEQEKAKLERMYSDACDAVYAAIIRDNPDALAGLIQAALEANPFLRRYCEGETPEEQYRESIALTGAVHTLMNKRYPNCFQSIYDDYRPRLDALDAKIKALG